MHKACVVQFTKTPQVGKVKTRMQPHLTQQQSCYLHDSLTCQVLMNLLSPRWGYRIFWAGLNDEAWRGDLLSRVEHVRTASKADPVTWSQQQGVDLGERMANAFAATLKDYRIVVLVGSDCPSLTERWVEQAIEVIEGGADVCFAPATDGGYVLVAIQTEQINLFEGVEWGTVHVLAQSLSIAERFGLQVSLLPSLADIDRPEDLALLSEFQWAAPFLESPPGHKLS